jgi:hypothetical protein
MAKLTLDATLRDRLNGLDEHLELCDEDGRTVGHYLPEAEYKKLLYAAVEAACPHTPEQLERLRHGTGGRTLAEIWRSLGQA